LKTSPGDIAREKKKNNRIAYACLVKHDMWGTPSRAKGKILVEILIKLRDLSKREEKIPENQRLNPKHLLKNRMLKGDVDFFQAKTALPRCARSINRLNGTLKPAEH